VNGHALAHTILSDGGGPIMACFALLIFSGLLRPFARGAPRPAPGPRPAAPLHSSSPDARVALPIALNAVELALLAELSLERAREQDALADDPRQGFETRRAASAAATAWRERARILQREARGRSGQPMLPGFPALGMDSPYTGPERRRHIRRGQPRRVHPEASSDDPGSHERRTRPDRRRCDRRQPELAPR
jgi:hypothetical protein